MIRSITSVKVTGRRVIVRAGFDVPLNKNSQGEFEVADDTRIKDALATLKYLIEQKAKIVLISHLGRPKGWDKEKSLWPIALKLGELLRFKVVKVEDKLPDYKVAHINFLSEDITKKDYSELSKQLPEGSILFLENLRFYPGEAKNEEKFIDLLGSFGDVYVNEAFSVAHRQEASTFGLARKLPAYAGISFAKEIASLKKVINNPAKPMVVLMGGIKIENKVETLHSLAKHAEHIIVGGGIANTFLKARGYEVGKSKVSDLFVAKELLRHYKNKIVLPIDVVVAEDPESKSRMCAIEKVLPGESIYDIGPESVRKFAGIISQGQTLVWNGPFGFFENPKYSFGSKAIAQAFATRSKGKAFGLVGGGETAQVVDMAKVSQFIDHVSTGGGAMLEFLAGKQLLAIKALEK